MGAAVLEPVDRLGSFARLLALELAEFGPEDLDPGCLSMKLAVSACLRRASLDLLLAEMALGELRTSLLDASGLSWSEEPLPLPLADRTQRVLNLCHYTYGLIGRAAAEVGVSRTRMVTEAMDLFDHTAAAR